MVLPTGQISFSDLRRVIGPNDTASISLGQCRPGHTPGYGKGLTGVTDTNIAMSQFRGNTKLNSGFIYRIFKSPTMSFSAGAGGAGAAASGGGAGGVIVSGRTPASPSQSGASGNVVSGSAGGIGYGAGGGSGGGSFDGANLSLLGGGNGANGFVYLYSNSSTDIVAPAVESFYESSTTHLFAKSGTVMMLLMGAGGKGSSYIGAAGGFGGNGGYLQTYSVNVQSGTSATITLDATITSIKINNILYTALAGGAGQKPQNTIGSSQGGAGSNTVGTNAAAGYSGGTNGQGTAVFSTAISYVSSNNNRYFADDPTRFNIWTDDYIGSTTDMSDINKATGGIVPTDSTWDVYSVEWFGYFYATVTDTYTFYTVSDDASYVWVGDSALSGYDTKNCLINNGNLHSATLVSNTKNLTKGTYYPIRCQFGENYGGDNFTFSFSTTTIPRTYNMSGYVFYSKGLTSTFPIESVRTLKSLFPGTSTSNTYYILSNGVATATTIT